MNGQSPDDYRNPLEPALCPNCGKHPASFGTMLDKRVVFCPEVTGVEFFSDKDFTLGPRRPATAADHTQLDIASVEAFILYLRISRPPEREMMMAYLRSKVCIECGAPDPDCPCWEKEAEAIQ